MTDIVGWDYVGEDIVGGSYGDDFFASGAEFIGDPDLARLMAMGADATSTPGAITPPQGRPNMNSGMVPRGARVVSTANSDRGVWREQYLPLNLSGGPTATIAALTTVTVQAQPQKLFRVNRLIISSDVAGAFCINDIRVGVRPQLASVGSLPGRMFSEQAFGIKLHGDTANISQIIFVTVQNLTNAAVPFIAGMQGLVLE